MRDVVVIGIEDAVLGWEELLPEAHFHLLASSNITLLRRDGMAAALDSRLDKKDFP